MDSLLGTVADYKRIESPPRTVAELAYHGVMRRTLLRIITAVQLTRLTMAFGAVSDLWFVILLTKAGPQGDEHVLVWNIHWSLALFLGAIVGVGLFAYGASLNDVLDVRHDSAFSPDRPIPAGRIRVGQAMIVAVGALLLAILCGNAFGSWSLQLTLLTAVGILFYNAAGRFIPSVGIVTIGLLHAVHMLIPNPTLEFTWPVWMVMTHSMAIGLGVYVLEEKRPRLTRPAVGVIAAGWVFWTVVILWWGIGRSGEWPGETGVRNVIWPILAVAGFVIVARWKVAGARGAVAAEKLQRYGAMWQSLYGAAWLYALGLRTEAMWIGLFALAGFLSMTLIKEFMGQMSRPLTFRE